MPKQVPVLRSPAAAAPPTAAATSNSAQQATPRPPPAAAEAPPADDAAETLRRSPRIAAAAAAAAAAAITAPPPVAGICAPCADLRSSGVRSKLVKPKKKRKDETKQEFEQRRESYKSLNHADLITEQADYFLEVGQQAEAATKRVDVLKAMHADRDVLKNAEAPGLNPYKIVEMFSNFRPLVPVEYQTNEIYREPTDEEWAVVKKEKKMNKDNKLEKKKMKKEAKEEAAAAADSRKAKKPRTTPPDDKAGMDPGISDLV